MQSDTVGGRFLSDPRLVQAKDLVLSALEEHQQKLTAITPPTKEGTAHLTSLLERMEKVRGAPLWYPYLSSGLGSGPLVELLDGSVKLDAVGGIGVHIFGHSHPRVIEASMRGALLDTVMEGHLQQGARALELSERLARLCSMEHCFLSTSGAMACENALKIAFNQRPGAHRVLAFERCFMGRTLSLSQITDKPLARPHLPPTLVVDYLPYFDPKKPMESTQAALAALKKYLQRYKQQHAVLIAELIQGEGGIRSGSDDFFKQIFSLARDEGVLVLVDEVQSFARTSKPFAFDHFGLRSYIDLVTIGKAAQVCATFYHGQIKPSPGLLSQTYTSSGSAIEAAIELLNLFEEEELFGEDGKNMRLQERFFDGMQELRARYKEHIHGPYGCGTMLAFTPLNGTYEQVSRFGQTLFEEGVLSFIAGSDPVRTRFLLPSLAMEERHMEILFETIETALCRSISRS